jgi:hypothetical protein
MVQPWIFSATGRSSLPVTWRDPFPCRGTRSVPLAVRLPGLPGSDLWSHRTVTPPITMIVITPIEPLAPYKPNFYQ